MSEYRGIELRYDCDGSLLEGSLAGRFRPVEADAATRAWIDEVILNPHSSLMLAARGAAKRVMSDYDANAMLDTHDMYVLGAAQWQHILGDEGGGRLLDVGAGDGRVTQELAHHFDETVTTEMSARMVGRLRQRGFTCHHVDVAAEALPDEAGFDFVAMLNLIDRASLPLRLLERARELLVPGGRLAVAVPLPLRPHVHMGARTVDPEEVLPIERSSWEAAANALAAHAFVPIGFEVLSLTRTPYLCRGDREHPVYVLDDAVFVLRRVEGGSLLVG